ncbi:MAG: outer membrane protein assembly factor BamB family protein, partial [Planctomycetota bacterium]
MQTPYGVIALLLFSLSVSSLAQAQITPKNASGHDWPAFLGPNGDSKSAETGILTHWPKSGPPLLWSFKTGVGYAMPVIADGKLFMFDRHGDNLRLAAHSPATGAQLWQTEYPTDYVDSYGYNNGPRCSPTVDGDRVYTYDPNGILRCHQTGDGALIWERNTVQDFNVVKNFFGVGSTPVIEGDLIIAQVGGSPREGFNTPVINSGRVKGLDSGVVAFNKMTGETIYHISDELASYSSPTLATINGSRWCFVFARGGLVAFNPVNGETDFHYPWRARITESVNASNPVVFGNHVFISECYGPGSTLIRINPDNTHEVVWKDVQRSRKIMQTHWNTAIYHNGYLYGSSGRHEGNAELRCIEALTGKVM